MPLYRVRTVFTGVQGSPWLNTLFFEETAGTAQQAADAAGAFWGAVDSRMATTVSWSTEAEVAIVNEATNQITSLTTTTPVTGTGAGGATQLPIETQGLVRLRTGTFVGGREVRGRFFIPGLTENDNDSGIPNAGITAVVNPAATTLTGGVNHVLMVFSRVHLVAHNVTSAAMWTSWAGLKSRRD
jgi:hypothetical protein